MAGAHGLNPTRHVSPLFVKDKFLDAVLTRAACEAARINYMWTVEEDPWRKN